MATIQERFEAAIEAAQHGDVHVRVNVMECCRRCVTPQQLGLSTSEDLKTTPHAWHFGGQGSELVWRNGEPFFLEEAWEDEDEPEDCWSLRRPHPRDERPTHLIYFNHGGPDLTAAETLAECFRMQGFSVEWNGTESDCVQVHV